MSLPGMRYASKGIAGRHRESAPCHRRVSGRTLSPATSLNLHALDTRDRLSPAVMSQAELRNERAGCIPGFCICKGSLGMSRVCPAHVALTSCRYRCHHPCATLHYIAGAQRMRPSLLRTCCRISEPSTCEQTCMLAIDLHPCLHACFPH